MVVFFIYFPSIIGISCNVPDVNPILCSQTGKMLSNSAKRMSFLCTRVERKLIIKKKIKPNAGFPDSCFGAYDIQITMMCFKNAVKPLCELSFLGIEH